MWHKPCRTFHPWCLCIKTRCLSSPCSGSVVRCDLVYRPPKYDQRAHLWRFCFKWFLYLKYDSPRASGMRDSNVFHISGSWWFSLLLVWVRYWTTAAGRVTWDVDTTSLMWNIIYKYNTKYIFIFILDQVVSRVRSVIRFNAVFTKRFYWSSDYMILSKSSDILKTLSNIMSFNIHEKFFRWSDNISCDFEQIITHFAKSSVMSDVPMAFVNALPISVIQNDFRYR